MKPRLLDLFCGAGGASEGYARAGFDVVGVDINPQPNYPFEFHQGDALVLMAHMLLSPQYLTHGYGVVCFGSEYEGRFDAIHASPPCQRYSILRHAAEHTVELCGSMFGLGSNGRQLRRHRLFETNFGMLQPQCQHSGEAIGVYGGGPVGRYTLNNGAKKDYYGRRGGYQGTIAEKREAMDIDWMSAKEINQAIPPAYTEFIGAQLLAHITQEVAA